MLQAADPLDLASLRKSYASGRLRPSQLVAGLLQRIAQRGDDKVWIHRLPREALEARAAELERSDAKLLPLYGIPFAIKDNIDLAGHPTTAGCPEFRYLAKDSAPVVERLLAAGAIALGKTNLDQFATGLVGVRSPYGVPGNSFNPEFIPGGSSSGSAIAVAAGLASFSLGTDTAGSGRVPAAFNNLVGHKPTCGLLSTRGVVPACRSLDCVSIFALTTDDAWAALAAIAGSDAADPYSRAQPLGEPGAFAKGLRLGVPIASQRNFFGDRASAEAYDAALDRCAALGATIVQVDIEPFYQTARLLYEGPWVAERYLVLRSLLASSPESIHPVTKEIVLKGAQPSAADTFAAFYKLAELRRVSDETFRQIDALLVPTIWLPTR